MKKIIRFGILSIIALFAANAIVFAQERGGEKSRPSPNATVSQTIGTTVVSVTYGRPGLKGRDFDMLAPAGKVWRTGANESTVITFSGPVTVGGKAVDAGTYSLYTIPGASEWTIIINKKLSWGTQYDKAMDVVRAKTSVAKGTETEWFMIGFDSLSDMSAHMNLRWGDRVVSVPIFVK